MKIGIVAFPGSTGEKDIQEAIVTTGFKEEEVTLVDEKETEFTYFDALFLPGGSSYGDSIRPGAVAKVTPAGKAIVEFSTTGKPIIGIGNGFQILTELDLLPGGFLKNKQLKTLNGFYEMTVTNNQTMLTNKCEVLHSLKLPISHKYGQYTANDHTLAHLEENNQIILTYKEENPSGSALGIVGIQNEAGNVIGLMAKPERAMESILGSDAGSTLFGSFYDYMNLD